jgi:hypothetical protein
MWISPFFADLTKMKVELFRAALLQQICLRRLLLTCYVAAACDVQRRHIGCVARRQRHDGNEVGHEWC